VDEVKLVDVGQLQWQCINGSNRPLDTGDRL